MAEDEYEDGFVDENSQEHEEEEEDYPFDEDDHEQQHFGESRESGEPESGTEFRDTHGSGFGKHYDDDDAFEDDDGEAYEDEDEPPATDHKEEAAPDAAMSRGSSREFQEADLPWADDDYQPAENAFEEPLEPVSQQEDPFRMGGADGNSRASSREFQEPNLRWAQDQPETYENEPIAEDRADHVPAQPSFHRDDGSRASSREFEEPNLPWAQDPSPTTVKFGEDDYEDDFARTEESGLRSGPQTQESFYNKDGVPAQRQDGSSTAPGSRTAPPAKSENVWGEEDLMEALQLFKAGDYEGCVPLARKAKEKCNERTRSSLQSHDELPDDQDAGDAWRAAMDKLASAHESSADVERAEALYLRMLAWREGADQFEAGNFEVGRLLFKKSSTYRSVEDATWFLHNVKPDDGHMGMEAVALLALGEEVAAKAAIAVWTLALRASQREQLTRAGALELTAKAIAFHGNNAELQAAGAGVLRLLCGGHRLAHRNRRRLIFLGGAESILNAIQTFQDDCEVMREACGALRAMAHKNPVGARRIIENNGFRYCIEALEHPDDAVSSLACKAIGALQCAAEVDFRGNDAQAENLQALWQARLREEREAGLKACCEKLRGPLTTGVLEAILAAICIFMEDPIRYKFLNTVQPVVVCMQMFPGNERIQVPSCQILLSLTSSGSLSNENEEAIQKFAKSGGISPLVQAMKDLPCHLHLQRLAMGVLRNFLSGGDMNKTAAARCGTIPTLITAMQRFKKDAELQEEAIMCLTSLCDTLGRASVAARLGLVDAIIAAIKSQNYGEMEGKLTEISCMILCMFSDDQKLRQEIVKAGGLTVAKQVISKATNLDVQRWGCELLRSLSQPS